MKRLIKGSGYALLLAAIYMTDPHFFIDFTFLKLIFYIGAFYGISRIVEGSLDSHLKKAFENDNLKKPLMRLGIAAMIFELYFVALLVYRMVA